MGFHVTAREKLSVYFIIIIIIIIIIYLPKVRLRNFETGTPIEHAL